MSIATIGKAGERVLLMGNEAIARGALEAGIRVATAYPGTPSSEIVDRLAHVDGDRDLYVEWSVNEKVSLEVAAAASYSGLRSICAMKQVGVNVAADFLLHMAQYGTRGGIVLASCEDPGALSSTNEGDSRPYAKMMGFPLIEPGDFQEAKDMTRWAFSLSEEIRNVVMLRSVTRISHASGDVELGELPETTDRADFQFTGELTDFMTGPVLTTPNLFVHQRTRQLANLERAAELFEDSPFNHYSGPEQPELLIVTSSVCGLYCREAIATLGVADRVGLLALGTTWPLPPRLLVTHLKSTDRVLIVEELTPFLEDNVKTLAAEAAAEIAVPRFFGKKDGTVPPIDELNPDRVATSIAKVLGISRSPSNPEYLARTGELVADAAPSRAITFCPGCPHRASYWLIDEALKLDNRRGFVCGDIGCYTLAAFGCGFNVLKISHAMGSGAGLASGFGKLSRFDFSQPVMAVCGDSTFFHAAMPALVNAIHNNADMLLVILDNSGTAMTGFQPHPGTPTSAAGEKLPALSIPKICEAFGAPVTIGNPFDFQATRATLQELLEGSGPRVLILEQPCALSPEKKGMQGYRTVVDQEKCVGEDCGCNRLCTRLFKCPGLNWNPDTRTTEIDEVICTSCGVCVAVCPHDAIELVEVGAP